jgi:hypothetical protein
MHCNASTVYMRQLFFCVPKMAAVVRDSLIGQHICVPNMQSIIG